MNETRVIIRFQEKRYTVQAFQTPFGLGSILRAHRYPNNWWVQFYEPTGIRTTDASSSRIENEAKQLKNCLKIGYTELSG
jgi:hypothetical protein